METDCISEYLEKLNLDNSEKEKDRLKYFLDNLENNEIINLLSTQEYVKLIVNLLKNNSDCVQNAALLVADLTKTCELRNLYTNESLVITLMDNLKQCVAMLPTKSSHVVPLIRAVGNLCYENDNARKLLHKHNFNEYLDKLLTCSPNSIDLCVLGCLLNYINTEELELGESMVTESLCVSLVNALKGYSHTLIRENMDGITAKGDSSNNDSSKLHSTRHSNTCTDLNNCKQDISADQLIKYRLVTTTLIDIINSTEIGKKALKKTPIISTLYDQLRDPDITNQSIAADLLCELLLDDDDMKRSLLACYEKDPDNLFWLLDHFEKADHLLVNLLTCDEVMNTWFVDKEMRKLILKWLNCSLDKLKASAALCYANFARKEENIKLLLDDNMHKVFMEMLIKDKQRLNLLINEDLLQLSESTSDEDENSGNSKSPQKLQINRVEESDKAGYVFAINTSIHGYLSFLRNVAVLEKKLLIKENIISHVIDLIHSDFLPIQYKVVSLFRMLIIDGVDSASKMIGDTNFLETLVVLSQHQYHPQVKAESSRFLCSIVKYARSVKTNEYLIKTEKVIPAFIDMISGIHPLMHNEAILAITILITSCLESMKKSIEEFKLMSLFLKLLSSNTKGINEIRLNILTGIKYIFESCDTLKLEYLKEVKDNINNCNPEQHNVIKSLVGEINNM